MHRPAQSQDCERHGASRRIFACLNAAGIDQKLQEIDLLTLALNQDMSIVRKKLCQLLGP